MSDINKIRKEIGVGECVRIEGLTEAPTLDEILKDLLDHLQTVEHEHCVSVSVFINCEGYSVERKLRTPTSLERSYTSMRNLRGEWIK